MDLVIIKKTKKDNKNRNLEAYYHYLAYDEVEKNEVILFTGRLEAKGFRQDNCFTFDIANLPERFYIIERIDAENLKVTFEF